MISSDHDEHDKRAKQTIIDNIEQYGCHLALIEADNYLPGFVYSIGLFKKFRHPEIICFGLKTEVMAAIINHACELVKNGQTLQPYKNYSGFLEGFEIQFVPVDRTYYPDYLGYAGWFYDMSFDFESLQLVWTDKQNKFPWESGFNPEWKFKQPLLDRNTTFKFYEEKNLGVYSTKSVFAGAPILFVYHNEDGDWQFHSDTDPSVDDGILVCLEEIVKLDSTINELFRLQFGWRAWRKSSADEWQFEEDLEQE
jgi:hypothetical protein